MQQSIRIWYYNNVGRENSLWTFICDLNHLEERFAFHNIIAENITKIQFGGLEFQSLETFKDYYEAGE